MRNVQVECPAGNFTLTFADSLPNDVHITVVAGAGNPRLVVPAGVAASVAFTDGQKRIITEGAWAANGYTPSDSGATWTIMVEMGVVSATLASI